VDAPAAVAAAPAAAPVAAIQAAETPELSAATGAQAMPITTPVSAAAAATPNYSPATPPYSPAATASGATHEEQAATGVPVEMSSYSQ
jgi:hypothetical protein